MILTLGMRGRFAPALRSLLLVAAVALVGCGPPTKHDIVKKAEGVETKQELEAALGAPDDISLRPSEPRSIVGSKHPKRRLHDTVDLCSGVRIYFAWKVLGFSQKPAAAPATTSEAAPRKARWRHVTSDPLV